MIFSKLPGVLHKEIIHTVGSNYPSLGQIFISYSNIIRTLILTKPREASVPKPYPRGKSKHSGDGKVRKLFHKGLITNGKPSSLENFRVDSKAPRYECNFCRTNDHISFLCKKYASLAERLARCKEIDLCSLCTRPSHPDSRCLGRTDGLTFRCWECSSKSHSSALCSVTKKAGIDSNVCYQTRDLNQDLL